MPGVVAAGWTTGIVEMDRAIRFPAADWREGDKINRDKLATAVSGVLAKTLVGEARRRELEPDHRQAEAELQAAEPDLSRARIDRHDRGRPAWSRRTSPAGRTG